MKDFIKWLGVNEKVAKVVVWIFLAMIMLVITNTTLESMGLPFYKITIDNLSKLISSSTPTEWITSWIVGLLNFYSIVFLVFKIKNFKKIFPYSILFLAIQIFIEVILRLNFVVSQISIFLFIIAFCYFYSGRKPKYLVYGIISFVINTVVQYICYLYKARFIDYNSVNQLTKTLLGLDYFIIMIIIILVKEIYLKKRGEKDDTQLVMVGNIREGEQNSKKNSSKTNKKR